MRRILVVTLIVAGVVAIAYLPVFFEIKRTEKEIKEAMLNAPENWEESFENTKKSIMMLALSNLLSVEKNPKIKQELILELMTINRPYSIRKISSFLLSSDPTVRHYSAFALGEMKDKRAVSKLCTALVDEKEKRISFEIINSIMKIGSPKAVACLSTKKAIESDEKLSISLSCALFTLTAKELYREEIVNFIKNGEASDLAYLALVLAASGREELSDLLLSIKDNGKNLKGDVNAVLLKAKDLRSKLEH